MPFVQAGSVRLEYRQTGAGDRVVILVHGLTASHRAWHVVQDHLGDLGFRTVAIANRGAAGSDRTPEVEHYTPSQFAGDLAAAMGTLGIARAALVGASLGARTVTRFVQKYPEKVACLALVAGGSLDARQPLTEDERGALERRAATWPASTSHDALAATMPEIPPDVREAFIRDVLTLEPKRLLAPHLDGESLRPVLRAMPVATLVVFGDRDDAMDPGDCARAYLDLPPDRRHLHVFHDVGHSVNAEVPKALARTLRRFFDRVYPLP